jgi:8-oxo-dGTP pyrophosphatase MutT (NUDIX family)
MKEILRGALERYEPTVIAPGPHHWEAAVLVLLYEHDGTPHVVFQKRTETVEAHKGQISFPGGGADPGDTDLEMTALRETHEEIGVDPRDIDVLGRLDDMVTVSNFRVTPYVGWLGRYPYTWRFSEHEVAYLLEVPVPHLLDPTNLVPDRRQVNGQWYVLPSFRFANDLIWGATARMLANFLDIYSAAHGIEAPSLGLGRRLAGPPKGGS